MGIGREYRMAELKPLPVVLRIGDVEREIGSITPEVRLGDAAGRAGGVRASVDLHIPEFLRAAADAFEEAAGG